MRTIYIVMCLLLASQVWAQDVVKFEGVKMPFHLKMTDNQADVQLLSYALRVKHGEKYYIGSVYGPSHIKGAQMMLETKEPMVMRTEFLTNIPAYEAPNGWTKAMSINNSTELLELHADDILSFKKALSREFKPGDVVLVQFSPETGMTMYLNGKQQGHWKSRAFFNMTLNTWIGPHPPSREFKRAILNFPTS